MSQTRVVVSVKNCCLFERKETRESIFPPPERDTVTRICELELNQNRS